jgi:uncharacterized protein YuzE
MSFLFTDYFETQVLRKRPYIKREWCIAVVKNPLRCEPQEHGRFCFWAAVPELGGRYLRVITLEDKVTIHKCLSGSRVPAMKLNYFPETDSLYIDLSEQPSAESREISEGVVLDYDSRGNLVGIDIDNASRIVDLRRLVLSRLPGKIETAAA